MYDRTGRAKAVKAGQVRVTAWLRLFQLAGKAEHLEAVAETFPRWRESGKSFTPLHAEAFVRPSITQRRTDYRHSSLCLPPKSQVDAKSSIALCLQ